MKNFIDKRNYFGTIQETVSGRNQQPDERKDD